MSRAVVACAALLLGLCLSVPGAVAEPAATFHYKEFSEGANVVFSPNCPWGAWLPTVDTVCDTYTVWYDRFDRAVDGGPVDRASAAFHAEIDHETDLVHPDGSGYAMAFEFGTNAVTGTYDKTQLSSAHMDAVTIALNEVDLATGATKPNGRVATLGAFTWTAAGGPYVYGDDGPAFADGARHLSSRCETANRLAHQKDSVGYVTGSVDGVPLTADYLLVQIPGLQPNDGTGYIFNNWFHVDSTIHCFQ